MLSLHAAFWVLKQLHHKLSPPNAFVNVRVIRNLKPHVDPQSGKTERQTEVLFNENIEISKFKERWEKELLSKLITWNTSQTGPANIYFGVNPRPDKNANTKAGVLIYNSFYLDLDVNKTYTREMRLKQIEFWTRYGCPPSFVIDSGNGFHVYWVLSAPVHVDIGQPLLKKMVAITGCKSTGNTHDATRVLRLPGFFNTKEWYDGKLPSCSISSPTNYEEIELAARYPIEYFEYFPPSEIEDLKKYEDAATLITGELPFDEKIKLVAQAAAKSAMQQTASNLGQAIAQENTAKTATLEHAKEVFTPKLSIMPPVEDLRFGPNNAWMKKYCKKGFDGLEAHEIDELKVKFDTLDLSASELDFKVTLFFAKKGYNKEAVREFWMRESVKLHRPDKEAKNPNYFDMTYDKALEQAQATAYEKAHPELAVNTGTTHQIFALHHKTYLKDPSKDLPIDILNGELILNAIYEDEDNPIRSESEHFDVTVILPDESKESVLIPGEAFSNLAKFKEHVKGSFCIFTNDNSHLQRLKQHLIDSNPEIPRHKYHSKLVYIKGADDGPGQYVFPRCTVTKDSIHMQNSDGLNIKLAKKHATYNWFDTKVFTRDQAKAILTKNWKNLLSIHLPRVVISVLGSIAASGIRPRFEQELGIQDFHIPTINIRGSSHSGKTETVKKLCSLSGMSPKATTSAETSQFALQKLIETVGFLPVVIDEFKQTESNAQKLEQLRSLVRRIYSGEDMLRGRANLDLVSISLHGNAIILGETALERLGDVSEASRVLPVTTDEYQTEHNLDAYLATNEVNWQGIGPLFYQYLLNIDLIPAYERFKELRRAIIEDLKSSFAGEKLRIAHNLATLIFGCSLWDDFVQSLNPEVPTIEKLLSPRTSLVSYICAWALDSGQSMRVWNSQTKDGVVIANNEFFQFLSTIKLMIESNATPLKNADQSDVFSYETIDMQELSYALQSAPNPEAQQLIQSKIDDIKPELKNVVMLKMSVCHSLYKQFSLTLGEKNIPSLEKLRALIKSAKIKGEVWIKDTSKDIKRKGHTHKVIIMDLIVLRQLNLWTTPANISVEAAT